jgi:alpha-methylacyl-CoA racemase
VTGPLTGTTVIELAGIGPGPFACMLLADMGAQVVRVDRRPSSHDTGPLAAAMRNDSILDRGRRSIALDMKDPRGVELVLDLVTGADVLIEGFRPGVAEKLGVGPDACRSKNRRLVYGRMTGWGQNGPLAQAAGHDLNYIALSGALHAMGSKDRPPMPPLNLVGDYGGGGMLLALGVIAALLEAQRSGEGQVVDAAMVDGAALLMTAIYAQHARGFWQDDRESNMLDGGAPFYGCYECADGQFISIAAIEPQFYRMLLDRCGVQDPLFANQWDRGQWPAMKAAFARFFRTRTREAWCALLEGSDACFAPVLSMAEAPQHAHCAARGTFVDAEGAAQPAPAPRFSRTPSAVPPPAPRTGEHGAELLHALGRSEAQIEALIDSGILYQPDEIAR